MAPLTDMMSETMAFKWTPECQLSFDELKKLISKEVLLSFPDYTQKFDASDCQLGAVPMQNGTSEPLAYFSKKLNKHQQKHTVGEKEMLWWKPQRSSGLWSHAVQSKSTLITRTG